MSHCSNQKSMPWKLNFSEISIFIYISFFYEFVRILFLCVNKCAIRMSK